MVFIKLSVNGETDDMNQKRTMLLGACILFATTMFMSSDICASENEKEPGWNIGVTGKKTVYVAHWIHTPENCPGRNEDGAMTLRKFWEGRKMAEEKGITILGAYATVTEHDFFIILEASDFSSVVEFFLPLVPSQTGKIVPVLTMDECLRMVSR
ncbi:MAG: hypothetical protein DCC43_01660 [Candidatus Brocadia sp.]|nr:DUF3303 domain-containing protein [Candidatus Brocadia sp. AMX3]MDG5995871.1 DUF3303 domain-containing protein [Candidatus Brocadia sp.]RIK02918.1 MAG: hypothetical protein DCC43_01660 [Candidatus Brocadia sp.]